MNAPASVNIFFFSVCCAQQTWTDDCFYYAGVLEYFSVESKQNTTTFAPLLKFNKQSICPIHYVILKSFYWHKKHMFVSKGQCPFGVEFDENISWKLRFVGWRN